MKHKVMYLFITFFLIVFFSASLKALAKESNVTKIGSPIHSVTFLDAAFGIDQNDNPRAYAVASNGTPAVLNVLDGENGELVNSFDLDGSEGAWGLTVAPNGDVYMTSHNSAYLYRYTPGDDRVERFDVPSPEIVLYSPTYDEQGRIYFGSYPNAKVLMFDPATEEFRDYGTVAEGANWLRSVSYSEGKIYAGAGIPAHLIEIDAETGEMNEIMLPEEYKNSDDVYDVDVINGKIFARIMPDYTLLVYDIASGEWIKEVPYTLGLGVSPEGPDQKVYFRTNTKSESLAQDQNMHVYDLETNELTDTGFTMFGAPRSLGWFELDDPEFPGKTLVGLNSRGHLTYYNPATGKTNLIHSDAVGIPNELRSIETGPNGNIFVGGYLSPQGAAVYNPDTNEITDLPGMSQVEGMTAHEGKMYFGKYPAATMFEYDPNQPWEYGTNPRELFSLQEEHEQDRPFAMISAGENLAIGTVPISGRLGGALTLYDSETEEYEVFRNIVEDQSVSSLAYKDDLIYGGTRIWGGLGVDPTATEGKLFIFDQEQNKKVWEGVPVTGEKAVSALTFDEEGYLWGLTSGTIFKFDPESQSVVLEKEIFPNDDGIYHYGRGMAYQEDGYIYGTTMGKVFQFDPKTLNAEVLTTGATDFAQDKYGDIYFYRGSSLYKLELPTSVQAMQQLIDSFEATGDIKSGRSLKIHLTAVGHYVEQGKATKVVKHMKGFKQLLNHQKENELISEKAYNTLKSDTETLVKKWSEHVFRVADLLPPEDTSGREYKMLSAVGTNFLFYRAATAGDYLTFTIDVEEEGDYTLSSQFIKSPLYGQVAVSVDGKPLGGVYDGYNSTVKAAEPFVHGDLHLTAGKHSVRYETVGKNADSGNYYIGLSAIKLTMTD